MSEPIYYAFDEQTGAEVRRWLVKLVPRGAGVGVDAYVGLNQRGEVVERSSAYGRFEGAADWVAAAPTSLRVGPEQFAAAWHARRASTSRWGRLQQRLNGVSDERDPTID